ncbi:MAG: hypothetical protein Q8M31_13975 [Beijerinckiaceae bacterium]|nr:hypothetical protein [Beijerinckiaceae bacterium]
MSIEQQSYLNEILVRFRRDGSLAGSHQIFVDTLVDTASGAVLSERSRPATVLDPNRVSAVLGEAFTTSAIQIARLEEEVAVLKANPVVASTSSQVVSDRQFFQGLALRGFCTPDEALDAVRTGVLPKGLRVFVDAIHDAQHRWAAEMLLSGAKEFRRDHPIVAQVGAWVQLDATALDVFWSQCSSL